MCLASIVVIFCGAVAGRASSSGAVETRKQKRRGQVKQFRRLGVG